MIVRRLALLILVAALLPGCAWLKRVNPFASNDVARPAPLMEFSPEAEFETLWRGTAGAGIGQRFNRLRPAIVDDRIYVADAYGLVQARDRDNGEVLWQKRVDFPETEPLNTLAFWYGADDGGSFVSGGVHADPYAVFVGTVRGDLIALRADDGAELWRTELSSEVLAPANSDESRVYVATADGRLRALSRSDGSRIWSHDTQVPVLSLRGTAHPVLRQGFVFQGFANGRLVTLRGDSGQLVWESAVGTPSGRSELERMADVDSAPLLTQTGLFANNYQGVVKSLRPQDGSTIWERPVSSHQPLAEGYGQVYAVDEQGVIHAFDANTGNVAWEQEGLLRRGVTGAATTGGFLLVADDQGYLHAFAQSDGRPMARVRVERGGVRNVPVIAGGNIYVLGNGGRLVAYRLERL